MAGFKKLCVLAALFLTVLLTACSDKKKTAVPSEGGYLIYQLNRSMTSLETRVYETETTDTGLLIGELMEQFISVPNEEDLVPALGDQAEYRSYTIDGSVLYLDFSEDYGEMRTERKTLCNAALTRTMTQIPGIDHVCILSGGQTLRSVDGNPYPPFAAGDFVDSISNVNSFETAELTLYFASSEEDKLKKEVRTVTYRMDTPAAQLIVEQLIEGPRTAGCRPVIAPDTRLLSVSVNDNVCYLNFSREFLNAIPDQNPNLTIYAIVNSLVEQNMILRVQIAVEGAQNVLYKDVVSLDTLFEENPDYLE